MIFWAKRIGRFSLAALLTTFATGAWALPSLHGDVNFSGEPDASDIVLLINRLGGTASLSPSQEALIDANQSGGFDATDVDWVVRAALGEVGLYSDTKLFRFREPLSEMTEGGAGVVEVQVTSYSPGAILTYLAVTGGPNQGTATVGQDFTAFSGQVTVQNNRALIPVSLPDDAVREGYETIVLQLSGLPAFSAILPTRHTILLADNDELWRGTLQEEAGPYSPFTGIDVELIRNGGSVTAKLLGNTTPSISNGTFTAQLAIFSPSSVILAWNGLPITALGEQLDDFPATRNLVLGVTPGFQGNSITDAEVRGDYIEGIAVEGASYLNTNRQGTFMLRRVPEYRPEVQPEVQTIP